MKNAVKKFWTGMFDYQTGRVTRADFWWNVLATGLIFAVLYGVQIGYFALLFHGNFNHGINGGDPRGIFPLIWGGLIGLAGMAFLLGWLSFTARRLHDAGFSVFLVWLWLVPVAAYILTSSLPARFRFETAWIYWPVAIVAALCALFFFVLCQFPSKK